MTDQATINWDNLYQPSTENNIAQAVHRTPIDGLWYFDQQKYNDDRGFYAEIVRIPELDAFLDRPFAVKQLNHSHSKFHVIRGFHAEKWRKLLTVISGTCFVAIADIRPESETFGTTVTALLGDDEQALDGSFFLSEGLANSFLVLEGPLNYLYSVDQLYAERDTSYDVAINLFDPDLGVEWPLAKDQMIMSDRDRNSISLREKFPEAFTE